MNSRIDDLKQAIVLSEQIIAEIEQHHWQRVDDLEKQRNQLIVDYFVPNQPINAGLALRLKDINDLIVQRLLEQRDITRQNQLDLHRGNQVSKAYLDNAHR